MSYVREVVESSAAWEGLRRVASAEHWSSVVRARFGSNRQPTYVHGNPTGRPHPAVSLGSLLELRSAIQRNASPAGPQQLAAMQAVVQDRLIDSGLVSTVEVERTEDTDHLVIALCDFPAGRGTMEQVAARLEWIWDSQIRYRFWEAHSLSIYADQIELSAATRPDATGNYVTLHLVAQNPPFPGQRTGGS
jgi:hypothetical protein